MTNLQRKTKVKKNTQFITHLEINLKCQNEIFSFFNFTIY